MPPRVNKDPEAKALMDLNYWVIVYDGHSLYYDEGQFELIRDDLWQGRSTRIKTTDFYGDEVWIYPSEVGLIYFSSASGRSKQHKFQMAKKLEAQRDNPLGS